MYEYLSHDENAKIAKAHAKWHRAKQAALVFLCVCSGVAVLVAAFSI